LNNKKAIDIDIIDISKRSSLADHLIIATSGSSTQTNAISKALEEGLRKIGFKSLKWEGKPESNWLILDLGSIIVHIMGIEERKKYSLEEIWGKSGITYHM